MCRLASLEVLELRENLIKSLPDTMARLSRLRSLDLGTNELSVLVRPLPLPSPPPPPMLVHCTHEHTAQRPPPTARLPRPLPPPRPLDSMPTLCVPTCLNYTRKCTVHIRAIASPTGRPRGFLCLCLYQLPASHVHSVSVYSLS